MTFKKNHKKYFASNKDSDREQNRNENTTILQWTRTVKIAVEKQNLQEKNTRREWGEGGINGSRSPLI